MSRQKKKAANIRHTGGSSHSIVPKVAGPSPASDRRYSNRRRSSPLYNKDDLDNFIRNSRAGRGKAQQARSKPSSTTPTVQTTVEIGIEESLLDQLLSSASDDGYSDNETPTRFQGANLQELYYRKIGYLPPWDDEVLALIRAVLSDSKMAKRLMTSNKRLPNGLRYDRNVHLEPSADMDPYAITIKKLTSQLPNESKESLEDQALQREVWKHDQNKCSEDNEALFQRTLMMAMIDRHRFFFDRRTAARNCYDFSVEKLWNCWPMPTRALKNGDALLPRPKPDLCVCFRTDELIPPAWMAEMPEATRDLILFEGTETGQRERAFPFLSIESKKSYISPNDPKALHQSLNNASQALHNMYEFFREAEDETAFFEKVRFFSAAAMSQGIRIRIHRAVPIDPEKNDNRYEPILPDHPLRFEYENFAKADGGEFERQKVVDVFENIIWGYGPELFNLLHRAAKSGVEKFENDNSLYKQRNEAYYRHGQGGGV